MTTDKDKEREWFEQSTREYSLRSLCNAACDLTIATKDRELLDALSALLKDHVMKVLKR